MRGDNGIEEKSARGGMLGNLREGDLGKRETVNSD